MWNLVTGLAIIVVPLVAALAIKRSWIAVAISTVMLTVAVHLTSYMGVGYIDPFFMVSVPIGMGVFLVWSALIAWLVRRVQLYKAKQLR
jgi:hypothetical protein